MAGAGISPSSGSSFARSPSAPGSIRRDHDLRPSTFVDLSAVTTAFRFQSWRSSTTRPATRSRRITRHISSMSLVTRSRARGYCDRRRRPPTMLLCRCRSGDCVAAACRSSTTNSGLRILAAATPRVSSATAGTEIERALAEYFLGKEVRKSGKLRPSELARSRSSILLASSRPPFIGVDGKSPGPSTIPTSPCGTYKRSHQFCGVTRGFLRRPETSRSGGCTPAKAPPKHLV